MPGSPRSDAIGRARPSERASEAASEPEAAAPGRWGRLEIRLLGDLLVLHDGAPVELPASRKTRALLGYLLVTARPHSRERLCELLWEAPGDPRAALRWSLWKLRPLVDNERTERLVATRDRVAIEAHGAVVDVTEIRAALASGVADTETDALLDAAARFRGELLEGLDLDGCFAFHEWWRSEREAWRRLHGSVLAASVDRLADRPEDALELARARVLIDPGSEDAHATVVDLLVRLGRSREAADQYAAATRMLTSQFGVSPGARLAALGRSLGRSDASSRRSPPERPRGTEPPIPLTGRSAERTVIGDVVASAADDGSRMLLLTGEPGIGKTRLLDELQGDVTRRGGRVLRSRAFEAERTRPYGPWVDALRAADLPELPDRLRADLASLLPEMGGERAELDDRGRIFDAVVGVVRLLAESGPLAVIIDDVHWLDEPSAALLHYAVRSLDETPIVVAVAARPGDLEDNPPALQTVEALDREGRVREVALGPLDPASVEALVGRIAAEVDAARVVEASNGNPLLVVEMTRAIARGDDVVSRGVERLVTDRLRVLGKRSRAVVEVAAAYGRTVPAATLPELADLSPIELADALDELGRHGLLGPVDDAGYGLTHDVIRDVVYRTVSPPHRTILHARIAAVLADTPDPDDTLAGDAARHADLAGDSARCATACVRAANRCLRVLAYQEAEALAELGRRHAVRLEARDRVRHEIALLQVLLHPGVQLHRPGGLAVELARLCADAQQQGLDADLSAGLVLLARIHHLTWGDIPKARTMVNRAADIMRARADQPDPEPLFETARCLAYLEIDMPRTRQFFADLAALGPLAEASDRYQWGLGLVLAWDGDVDGARAAFQAAAQLAAARQDHWATFECTARVTILELEHGRVDAAEALCPKLAPLADKLGRGGSEANFAQVVNSLVRLGRHGDHETRAAVRAAVGELERIDATYLVPEALCLAAHLEYRRHAFDDVNDHAARALELATRVDRPLQAAQARALLVCTAAHAGRRDEASADLDELRSSGVGALLSTTRDLIVEAESLLLPMPR
jgi:DNA-binding SARP family transcriptional activator